jgi:hypothetical protein
MANNQHTLTLVAFRQKFPSIISIYLFANRTTKTKQPADAGTKHYETLPQWSLATGAVRWLNG